MSVEPDRGEVAAGGRLSVKIVVRADRVGYHGIHGLSLEVQGGPGLFEVPLTFSNPFGVEVLPHAYAAAMRSPRGGRSRMSADEGRPGPLSGDGMELRELREHQPGDPFKRIAWKASAHRGKLMVRDYEREERDVVWLLLDASVELWSGVVGRAPLDIAVDEVASVAQRHLARGDRVGLGIIGARVLSWIVARPRPGARHSLDDLVVRASHDLRQRPQRAGRDGRRAQGAGAHAAAGSERRARRSTDGAGPRRPPRGSRASPGALPQRQRLCAEPAGARYPQLPGGLRHRVPAAPGARPQPRRTNSWPRPCCGCSGKSPAPAWCTCGLRRRTWAPARKSSAPWHAILVERPSFAGWRCEWSRASRGRAAP